MLSVILNVGRIPGILSISYACEPTSITRAGAEVFLSAGSRRVQSPTTYHSSPFVVNATYYGIPGFDGRRVLREYFGHVQRLLRDYAHMPKMKRTSISLDDPTEKLARDLMKERGISNFTDYVKGLIAVDALVQRGPMELAMVPRWVVVAYSFDVVKGRVIPNSIAPKKKNPV
jgi:hypothetical protein